MTSQQSSVASQTEQKAAPAALSFTEEEWDAAAAVVLRAEIGRMDAVAAATATATAEDKSIIIDGLLLDVRLTYTSLTPHLHSTSALFGLARRYTNVNAFVSWLCSKPCISSRADIKHHLAAAVSTNSHPRPPTHIRLGNPQHQHTMHIKTRNTPPTGIPNRLPVRTKEPLVGSELSSSNKRSGKIAASPSAVQSKGDVAAQATLNGGHVLPQSAPVELLFHLPAATSSHVKEKELSPAVKLKPAAPLVKQPEPNHGDSEVAKIISDFETVEDLEALPGFSLADLGDMYGMSAELQDDLRDEDFQGDAARYFYSLGGLNKKGEEGVDSDSDGAYDDLESSTFICEDSPEDEYDEGECEGDSDDEVEVEDDEDAEEDADDEEPETVSE
ncbi:hypothetical protein Q7P35_001877 [Cladosporium inversicolor]